jgi:hypothetical protein
MNQRIIPSLSSLFLCFWLVELVAQATESAPPPTDTTTPPHRRHQRLPHLKQ